MNDESPEKPQEIASGEATEEQTEHKKQRPADGKTVRRVIIECAITLIVLVLVLMYLAGVFHRKVGTDLLDAPKHTVVDKVPFEVTLTTLPRYEWAVGTIRAVNETSIGSKLLAKVVQIDIKAGQAVQKGQILAKLDDRDLQTRVEQAKSEVEAAEAAQNQAQVEYDRIMELEKKQAASAHEISTVKNQLRTAVAGLKRAQDALEEAQTVLSYATIRAPFDGVVVDKNVDTGDMVAPGQILARIYDPTQMQLVATVRESLARKLAMGQTISGQVPAIDLLCQGTITEIVPQTQAGSRSFDVKVVGPCPPNIYSGMFGRILIPLGDEQVILIPESAVTTVGQLDLVDVVEPQGPSRRTIQTGRTFADYIEVLSGLNPGEKVFVPASAKPTPLSEISLQMLLDKPPDGDKSVQPVTTQTRPAHTG